MFGIGMPEMILILAVALIVIGPKKLPDLAKSLGKAMGEFKKATRDLKDSMQIDTELKEVKDAFDDLGKDAPPKVKVTAGGADETPYDGTKTKAQQAQPEADDTDAMDQLKAAFDQRNTDADPVPEDTAKGDDEADPLADADAETRKA